MHLVLAICAIKKYVLALKQPFYATMVQTLHLKHPPNMPSFCFISFSNIHAAILISAFELKCHRNTKNPPFKYFFLSLLTAV